MYKTHIKQWGLDKKNKDFEMRAVVRKNKQRADQGKGSIIRIRGQLRDFAEVVRYWNRRGISIDDIIARRTASPTPEAVECFTPVPSPILTPEVLAVPERMFRCIRDYFEGSFESGTWVRTDPNFRCSTTKDKENTDECLAGLVIQCQSACLLFSRSMFQEAGQNLIAATAKIKQILSAELPMSLIELFRLINYVRREKRDEMALIVLRQFSALGKVLLGSEHPLSRICEWLDSTSPSGFDDTIVRCIESIVDQFERFVGPMHTSTLYARLIYIVVAKPKGNAGIQMLQKLLDECKKTLRPHDSRILLVRGYMAEIYFLKGYFVEARTLSQENIACSQLVQSTNARFYEQNKNLYRVARSQHALGEVDLGIATLHKVIDSIVSRFGSQDWMLRRILLDLEDWYLEQGRWNFAAQARDWWEKLLESIDVD